MELNQLGTKFDNVWEYLATASGFISIVVITF